MHPSDKHGPRPLKTSPVCCARDEGETQACSQGAPSLPLELEREWRLQHVTGAVTEKVPPVLSLRLHEGWPEEKGQEVHIEL